MKKHSYATNCCRKIRGFSYVEVLVATVFLAITLVPALETLEGALNGSQVHEALLTQQFHLQTKLEEVLAQSYDALDAVAVAAGSSTVPTSYSDAIGETHRRLVYLSKYDGDNVDGDGDPFTGVDDDLLWVRVEIEATEFSLETLTNR